MRRRTRELTIAIDGTRDRGGRRAGRVTFETLPYLGGVSAVAAASGELTAPMMGKVVAIRAGAGDRVAAGQIVIVLESMKMELHVSAPFDADVQSVRCALGDMVERGAVLAEVSADPRRRQGMTMTADDPKRPPRHSRAAREPMQPYLAAGAFVDSDHPAVVAYARREAGDATTPREIAVRLYYAVRDGIRYDPYRIDLTPAGMTASSTLANGYGFCITKAALWRRRCASTACRRGSASPTSATT